METLGTPDIPENEYKFFPDEAERDELFLFTKEVCEYLKREEIPNLVLVDRAIRPIYIGISEYWKAKYPDEKRPNIYFVNPLGLKSKESMSGGDMEQILKNAAINEDVIGEIARHQDEIDQDFRKTFRQLVDKKDKTLILDGCIHTGWQITLIKEALEKAMGIQNEDDKKKAKYIYLGAISLVDDSKVRPDFYLRKHLDEKDCHLFGKERLMAKTLQSVCSIPNESSENRTEARETRQEVRRIIKEHLK